LNNLEERIIVLDNIDHIMNVFGNYDENIKVIEESFNIKITARDNELKITGEKANIEKAYELINKLVEVSASGDEITKQHVKYLIQLINDGQLDSLDEYMGDIVCMTVRGRRIKAKTQGQKNYVDKIRKNDIVFGIGPAGTGKTFLAVSMAVNTFKNKEVDRIVLTRPAVEAGEKLGFLPGDLQEKVDPYLRPLYDALYEIMGIESYQKHLEKGMIEIAPLAYMRGRTLDNSFIILDEAQNTTPEQMKMFLTRLGIGSKAVITGDITQVDLPHNEKSGLIEVMDILKDVEGIEFSFLTEKDVVRHELVRKIIKAYEKFDLRKSK
jgi:phosphate starvation-inducible PhoH-like protein